MFSNSVGPLTAGMEAGLGNDIPIIPEAPELESGIEVATSTTAEGFPKW